DILEDFKRICDERDMNKKRANTHAAIVTHVRQRTEIIQSQVAELRCIQQAFRKKTHLTTITFGQSVASLKVRAMIRSDDLLSASICFRFFHVSTWQMWHMTTG